MAEFDAEFYKMLDNTHKDKTRVLHGRILTPHSESECEKWIAKRKETWRFHQQLLNSLTNSSRKDDHSRTKTWLPTKSKEIQALFKELKGFVESKRTQDEESALFIPRQMFLNSVENFRESPKGKRAQGFSSFIFSSKPEDSHKLPVERTKHSSIKQRILKFFRLK